MTFIRNTEMANACRPSAKVLWFSGVKQTYHLIWVGSSGLASSHVTIPLKAAWHSSQKVSLGIKEKRHLIVVVALKSFRLNIQE